MHKTTFATPSFMPDTSHRACVGLPCYTVVRKNKTMVLVRAVDREAAADIFALDFDRSDIKEVRCSYSTDKFTHILED